MASLTLNDGKSETWNITGKLVSFAPTTVGYHAVFEEPYEGVTLVIGTPPKRTDIYFNEVGNAIAKVEW